MNPLLVTSPTLEPPQQHPRPHFLTPNMTHLIEYEKYQNPDGSISTGLHLRNHSSITVAIIPGHPDNVLATPVHLWRGRHHSFQRSQLYPYYQPMSQFVPKYEGDLDEPTIFFKSPFIIDFMYDGYMHLIIRGTMRDNLSWDTVISQFLADKTDKHENIAKFLGAVVGDDELVEGLVFKRYAMDLCDFIRTGEPFDADDCLQQIRSGVEAMHSARIVHLDLKPDNIFVEDISGQLEGQPGEPEQDGKTRKGRKWRFVIGDFDMSRPFDHPLTDTIYGTPEWCDQSAKTAKPELDFYSLERIEWWLKNRGWGGKADNWLLVPTVYFTKGKTWWENGLGRNEKEKIRLEKWVRKLPVIASRWRERRDAILAEDHPADEEDTSLANELDQLGLSEPQGGEMEWE